MTIHITPEPECSYVSFESNIPQRSYRDVILRVLQCFKPGKFILTVFANKVSTLYNQKIIIKKYVIHFEVPDRKEMF